MTLIIAEKPSVAGELAKIVGASKREKGYYTGNGYYVSWCVGHLISAAMPEVYNPDLKRWSLDSLPIIPDIYKTVVNPSTAGQYEVLKKLMNQADVDSLICATDAGREGELIFRLVYDQAGCKKPFKRLWISSMEEKAIRDGLSSMKDGREYDNLYRAALCRQRSDWLLGINLTRYYSKRFNKTLQTGRVLTPTTNLLVKRQREIQNFVPETYYTIIADFGSFKAYAKVGKKYEAEEIVKRCNGKDGYVTAVRKEDKKENPAPLYDLTALQRETNRLLGFSAQKTLDVMQSLYDGKLATYPRTDSRYITSDMETSTRTLIDTLLNTGIADPAVSASYREDSVNVGRVVNNKRVTDHHALLPTSNVTKAVFDNMPLSDDEKKKGISQDDKRKILLLLIYRLFMAVYVPHSYSSTRAVFDIEGEAFAATGKEIIDMGFKAFEHAMKTQLTVNGSEDEAASEGTEDNATLPAMMEGDKFPVGSVKAEEKQTRPPKPYTEDTLLAAMEMAGKAIVDDDLREAMKNCGLGTPATRAGLIENMLHYGYAERKKKQLLPTAAAITYIDLVMDTVKEPELTAKWEKQLADISSGAGSDTEFMNGITSFLTEFISMSKALDVPETDRHLFKQEREVLGVCPKCGKNVVEYPKAYSCESGKDGCGFVVWKKIAGKEITKTQAKQLLSKSKTGIIKGFTSKAGNPFDAHLDCVVNSKMIKWEKTKRRFSQWQQTIIVMIYLIRYGTCSNHI